MHTSPSADVRDADLDREFRRGLGLYDATMVVVGSMIGSGIFIVSADVARRLPAPGWLLVVWTLAGLLTVAGARSYGALAAAMPRAGGQYAYLAELYGPLGRSFRDSLLVLGVVLIIVLAMGWLVAERLVLSSETVKTHIRNAMGKLEASTRVHAIAIALRKGFISAP